MWSGKCSVRILPSCLSRWLCSLATMASPLFRSLRRASSILKISYAASLSLRSVVRSQIQDSSPTIQFIPLHQPSPAWVYRNFSHGSVNLVISGGKTKFETLEVDPPKKEKWKTKKRLKLQRKREKQKRKAANKNDPRRLGVKGKKKKQKFANAEERIKYKLEKAKIKEAMLIERLKRYEIPRLQGPVAKPDGLTGEERFYLKKMAQKSTNYLQVGRRGLFGGVILNMHMHWKKHETVKVICKPCKPGQVHEYAQEIARLSGGIPIHIIGDDTIIFYRGKNYVQPEVMSPIDTLSKKKALEKSKYEQSLESVRRFIAIAEKELELYYRHVALYGDPNDRNPLSILERPSGKSKGKGNHEQNEKRNLNFRSDYFCTDKSDMEAEADSTDIELSETEDSHLSMNESDSEEDSMRNSEDDEERVVYFTNTQDDSAGAKHRYHYNINNPCSVLEQIHINRDQFYFV